jgi:formylglycine-generating enzyme
VRVRRPPFAWAVLTAAVAVAACGGRGCGAPRATFTAEGGLLQGGGVEAGGEDSASTETLAAGDVGIGDAATTDVPGERADLDAAVVTRPRCPKEMVDVAGRFCIDRYEDSLVDDATGERLSPHYPPEPGVAVRMFDRWQEERLTVGSIAAREMPLPPLPDIERIEDFRPRAVSLRGVIPQGYISGRVAGEACARAKKRLCTYEEWTFACRGEGQTKYPYGDDYQTGVCNVFRMSHPAAKLHDNASAGHSDPRLGLVKADDGPLLRTTGSTKPCASHWGKDAIYDMVGNADEWIDDPDGTFVGGFFSRPTKEGCSSIVTVHPIAHWDYSIGLRCCR